LINKNDIVFLSIHNQNIEKRLNLGRDIMSPTKKRTFRLATKKEPFVPPYV